MSWNLASLPPGRILRTLPLKGKPHFTSPSIIAYIILLFRRRQQGDIAAFTVRPIHNPPAGQGVRGLRKETSHRSRRISLLGEEAAGLPERTVKHGPSQAAGQCILLTRMV